MEFTMGMASRFQSAVKVVTQVRFATKRALGSRTSMKDSAGRRLGPKVGEGSRIKPGQIIMRQRGTKIHPGLNTGLGRDHTIYAQEPGYVHFYLDPFHPRRKYVGVSLTKSASLPYDHWAPRQRRFGHDEIVDPIQAQQEEDSMCRKETLAQDELKAAENDRQNYLSDKIAEYSGVVGGDEAVAQRLAQIHLILRANEDVSVEEAQHQVTYNAVFELHKLARRGELDSEGLKRAREAVLAFSSSVDSQWLVDTVLGAAYAYISPEEVAKKQQESLEKLQKEYSNRIIKLADKRAILDIIQNPGVFNKSQQQSLKRDYLPAVLPVSVKGTVVEIKDGQKPPKGVTVSRVYDAKTRKLTIVGRTKDAFVPEAN